MAKRVCLMLFVSVLLATSVWGLSVTPPLIETSYTPGLYQTHQLRVGDIDNFEINFTEDFPRENYEVLSIDSQKSGVSVVTIKVLIPENLAPGVNGFKISIKEKPRPRQLGERASGIYALTELLVPVRFFIPVPGKFLLLEKIHWDQRMNKGDPFFFSADVRNLGSEVMAGAWGEVTMVGPEKEYTAPFVPQENIPPDTIVTLGGEWLPPEDAPLGHYVMHGIIHHDVGNLTFEDYYITYGDEYLGIVSLSPQDFTLGGIVQFEVVVKSYWGQDMPFTIDLAVYDSTKAVVAQSSSAVMTVGKNSQATAKLFLDTDALAAGVYLLEVTAHYNNKNTVKTFSGRALKPAEIQKPGATASVNTTLLITVIILLLLILGYLCHFLMKKKGAGESL